MPEFEEVLAQLQKLLPLLFARKTAKFRDWLLDEPEHRKFFLRFDRMLQQENILAAFDSSSWENETETTRLIHLEVLLENHEGILKFIIENLAEFQSVQDDWNNYQASQKLEYQLKIDSILIDCYKMKPLFLSEGLQEFSSWLKIIEPSYTEIVDAFYSQLSQYFNEEDDFQVYIKDIWEDKSGSRLERKSFRRLLEDNKKLVTFLEENLKFLLPINTAWRDYLRRVRGLEKYDKMRQSLLLSPPTVSLLWKDPSSTSFGKDKTLTRHGVTDKYLAIPY